MKTGLLATRKKDFAEWYQQVIKAAGLAENAAVRGCMNIRPWGYAIWENIQGRFDKELKATGHKNAYFPLLIPLSFFQREAQHVDGFAKECAVVTHHRLKSTDGVLSPDPAAELEEPLVIRPTSETIIGDAFSRWVQSYKDLPLLINQWCNVVRWELRTRLFLRTSEFLWQEGHTAHATKDEAVAEARLVLKLYRDFVTDTLCMPVFVGEKSPGERFPGAVNTWSIEGMMQDGKALQAGTSHFLGQNFSQAYKIKFTAPTGEQFAWTTSWGISTRLIGGLIMTHSDDNGLVLPPAVSPVHVRFLLLADDPDEIHLLRYYANALVLGKIGSVSGEPLRHEVVVAGKRPGDAFWESVKQGVPIVAQIGQKELAAQTVTFTDRGDPELRRQTVSNEQFFEAALKALASLQHQLLERARSFRDSNVVRVESLAQLHAAFKGDGVTPFVLCPVNIHREMDPEVQDALSAQQLSIRCLPEEGVQETLSQQQLCVFTGTDATHIALIAKSY